MTTENDKTIDEAGRVIPGVAAGADGSAPCPPGQHELVEEYYGHRCKKCGIFYPNTADPADWMNGDEPDDYDDGLDEEEEWFDCGMYPGPDGKPIGCSLAGSEQCDFECPQRDYLYACLRARAEKEAKRRGQNVGHEPRLSPDDKKS